LIKLPSISEPEAIEWAHSFLKEKYGEAAYISCTGGEIFTTYQIDSSDKIINILTGNKCASGTGEFFLHSELMYWRLASPKTSFVFSK